MMSDNKGQSLTKTRFLVTYQLRNLIPRTFAAILILLRRVLHPEGRGARMRHCIYCED